MSTSADVERIEEEEAEDRFDELYRFLRDLIDDPAPLDRIPNHSELEFRSVRIVGQRIQLTAHRMSGSDAPWTARVTTWDSIGGLELDRPQAQRTREEGALARPSGHRVKNDEELVQTAETANAALDALEHVIRQRTVLIASGGHG